MSEPQSMAWKVVEPLPPGADPDGATRHVWATCGSYREAMRTLGGLLKKHPELIGVARVVGEPATAPRVFAF
jgi:hypothetical protein